MSERWLVDAERRRRVVVARRPRRSLVISEHSPIPQPALTQRTRMTTPNWPPSGATLSGIGALAHIGIRVHDLERSAAFYARLGFQFVAGPIGPEPVAILSHPSGLELNLILNAPTAAEANVLMDGPAKPAGITHFALLCNDLEIAIQELRAAGLEPSAGPVDFGGQARGLFLRDPDRTVIELHQRR